FIDNERDSTESGWRFPTDSDSSDVSAVVMTLLRRMHDRLCTLSDAGQNQPPERRTGSSASGLPPARDHPAGRIPQRFPPASDRRLIRYHQLRYLSRELDRGNGLRLQIGSFPSGFE